MVVNAQGRCALCTGDFEFGARPVAEGDRQPRFTDGRYRDDPRPLKQARRGGVARERVAG